MVSPLTLGEGQKGSRKVRVLVVETDEKHRSFVVNALRQLGHDVTEVSNGAEAVQAVADGDYDVVLMECAMPGMNGFDATRQIRSSNEWAAMRTVILGMTGIEFYETCLDAGMNGFIGRPSGLAELEKALEPYLSR